MTNIGGSPISLGNEVVGLVEMADKAVSILIFDESNSANLDMDVLLVKYIKLVWSEVVFDDLVSKPSEKYLGGSSTRLPPFVIKVVIEAIDHSPAARLTELMITMVTFDRENPSQDESVWTERGSILQFLWEASKNFLKTAVFDYTDDEKADAW